MMEQNNTIIDANHAEGNKQFVNSNHLPSNVVIFFLKLSVYEETIKVEIAVSAEVLQQDLTF